jgi:hypothetical protein
MRDGRADGFEWSGRAERDVKNCLRRRLMLWAAGRGILIRNKSRSILCLLRRVGDVMMDSKLKKRVVEMICGVGDERK